MTTLITNDLTASQALDSKAMAELTGGSEWHQLYKYSVLSAWSGYSYVTGSNQGLTFHDGYLSRHSKEWWKRTRVETEYSYWDHFVRI